MIEFAVVNTLGLTLLHFLWQGLLIGLVYALGKYLLKQARAESRYFWALCTLFLLLSAPLISFFLLHAPAPLDPGQAGGHGGYASVTAGNINAASQGTVLTLNHLLPWIVAFWVSGVLLMSLRLSLGWRYIGWLRRTANYRIPASHQALLEQLCQQLAISQTVRLAQSAMVHGPVLIGALRPLILIPATLATGLTPRQLEMVLAHELAHLKRFDHLVNLFQTLVETLLFYHPVVRWVSRDLRIERELASDEMATRLTGDRLAYAETLLMLERERGDRLELAMAMADHQVAARVRRLLAPARRQSGSIGAGMAALVLVMASVAVGLHDKPGDSTPDQAGTMDTPPTEAEAADASSAVAPRLDEEILATPGDDTDTASLEAPLKVAELAPREDPMGDEAVASVASDREAEASDEVPAPNASPAVSGVGGAGEETDTMTSGDTASSRREETPSSEAERQNPAAEEAAGTRQQALADTKATEPTAELTLARLDAATLPDTRPEPPQPAPASPVTGGELLHQEAPAYPRAAMRHGHEGSVEVRFSVDEQGRVRDAEVISESPHGYDFGREAVRAVEQWRFEPFRRDGETVSHEIRTGFDFEEPNECTRRTGTRISRC